MNITRLPSQDELRSLLDYNPENGELRWLVDLSARARKGTLAFGCRQKTGHMKGRLHGATYYAHRVAWKWYHGSDPHHIDHIDGNPSNNAIANLRSVSVDENARNRRLARSATGRVGISLSRGRYRADITVNGEQHFIGRFDTIEEAACARANHRLSGMFHENHGR